jgi:hypothetical protein
VRVEESRVLLRAFSAHTVCCLGTLVDVVRAAFVMLLLLMTMLADDYGRIAVPPRLSLLPSAFKGLSIFRVFARAALPYFTRLHPDNGNRRYSPAREQP